MPTTTLLFEVAVRERWYDELVTLVERYGDSLPPQSVAFGFGGVTGGRQIEYLAYKGLLRPFPNPPPVLTTGRTGGAASAAAELLKVEHAMTAFEHAASLGTARR